MPTRKSAGGACGQRPWPARGEFDEAERLGREALTIAASTDYLDAHAKATADLAEVLGLAGRPEESASALEDAIRLHDRKGNLVAAGILRSLRGVEV